MGTRETLKQTAHRSRVSHTPCAGGRKVLSRPDPGSDTRESCSFPLRRGNMSSRQWPLHQVESTRCMRRGDVAEHLFAVARAFNRRPSPVAQVITSPEVAASRSARDGGQRNAVPSLPLSLLAQISRVIPVCRVAGDI